MSENKLEIFTNSEFGNVRTVEIDSKIYLCGSDVAKALGYSNANDAISRHCRCIVKHDIPHPQSSNKQIEVSFIPEGDVYRLIAHSKLPSAEKFESWIFEEVLPTIRKHGAYMTPETIEKALTSPDFIIQLATQLKTEQEKRSKLEQKIEQDKPLVEFAEQIQTSKGTISMNEMAKLAAKNGIEIGRTRLFRFLREKKVLDKKNIPYQRYIETQPWFEVRESVYNIAGSQMIRLTTKVTPKGQIGVITLLKKSFT